jgi:hypothetical protein
LDDADESEEPHRGECKGARRDETNLPDALVASLVGLFGGGVLVVGRARRGHLAAQRSCDPPELPVSISTRRGMVVVVLGGMVGVDAGAVVVVVVVVVVGRGLEVTSLATELGWLVCAGGGVATAVVGGASPKA